MAEKPSYQKFQSFSDNTEGNDYVVGDLHGCYTLFMNELDALDFNPEKDRVFCVGDLIDRGPENEQCLSLIYEPWFFAVLGNHELLFYDGIHEISQMGGTQLWFQNGGNWFMNSPFSTEYIRFLSKEVDRILPLAMEICKEDRKIGIVHANPLNDWNSVKEFCQKNYDLDEMFFRKETDATVGELQKFETLTWGRSRIRGAKEDIVQNIDIVYVGHTILKEPLTLGNVRHIDTGGDKNNNLTIEKL